MRYATVLPKYEKENSINTSDKQPNAIHTEAAYDTQMLLARMYDDNEPVRKHYKRIVILSHPYDAIDTEITTSFIPNSKLVITNAFMKMYEFLSYMKYKPESKTLKMFDVAGAPGMFILGTEKYLTDHHPDTTLDWHCCSLVDGKNDDQRGALTDRYELFKHNPKRFTPCDVTNERDISAIIKKHANQYELVTGDIGVYHEDDYSKLQEENQLALEYGQAILALNLVSRGGIMFLKMYTFCTYHSLWLLSLLTQYFDEVRITKPFTSRMINDESYIVCIGRNDHDCSKLSLTKLSSVSITKDFMETVSRFETTRGNYRVQIVSILTRILEKYPHIKLKELRTNPLLKIFYKEIDKSRRPFLVMK